jgi:hypothetical protein
MRLVDFIIFYTMCWYDKKHMDGLLWNSPLRRCVFVAGLIITFCLFFIIEIIFFLTFKLNVIEFTLTEILLILGCLLMTQVFSYIYIRKKRYEFITSPKYGTFTLSTTLGVTICGLIFIFSFLGSLGVAIIIDKFLTK